MKNLTFQFMDEIKFLNQVTLNLYQCFNQNNRMQWILGTIMSLIINEPELLLNRCIVRQHRPL